MNFDMEGSIKQHFWFLVDEYKFSYSDSMFLSNDLELRITLEREPPGAPGTYLPGIYFKRVGEPDHTILTLYWLLYYFANAEPYLDFHSKSMNENMKYSSDLLKKYGQKIFGKVDDWWLPSQKFRLNVLEQQYQEVAPRTFQKLYDYIKAKEGH